VRPLDTKAPEPKWMPFGDLQPGQQFIQITETRGHWTCQNDYKLIEESYKAVGDGPTSNMVQLVPQHCESIATSGSDQ
jgi:hypothetical protein